MHCLCKSCSISTIRYSLCSSHHLLFWYCLPYATISTHKVSLQGVELFTGPSHWCSYLSSISFLHTLSLTLSWELLHFTCASPLSCWYISLITTYLSHYRSLVARYTYELGQHANLKPFIDSFFFFGTKVTWLISNLGYHTSSASIMQIMKFLVWE